MKPGGDPRGGSAALKARALRYLAQREHSRAELERKLRRCLDGLSDASGPAEESADRIIAQVLDELAGRGLLDERRAAEALVAARSGRFGARRLQQSLRARGIAPDAAASALAAVEASEADRARTVWQRRFGTPATDPAERARQARFLAGRGFDGDIIRRIVQGLDGDPG